MERGRRGQKKGGGVGANEERQGPGHQGPGSTKSRTQRGRQTAGGRKGEGTTTHKEGEKKTKKKKGGGRGGRSKQRAPRPRAPRAGKHKKPETAGAQEGRWEDRGRNKHGTKTNRKTEQTTEARATPGRRGPNKEEGQHCHKKGEAHQNAPRRPACPTQPRRACKRTHARDPGVASSDLKGEMSASTRNSHGAPAESPVDPVTGSTHAKPPQRTQPKTEAGGTPQRPCGASPAPLPRQGPAAGTMIPVLSQPPPAPRSRPVKPGATAPGVGEGTTATGKRTEAPRATGQDEARRNDAGPLGTPETHAASHNHDTRPCAKQQRPPGAANPGSAHSTRQTASWDKVPRTARPQARTPYPQPVGSGPRPHAPRTGGRAWESAKLWTPHTQARGAPPRAPSCRPHSAQSQSQERAVGLVTGPHAHTPRTHSQWVAAPGRTPQGRVVGRRPAPDPGGPTRRQGARPPGALAPPPQRVTPACKSAHCGFGGGSPHPHPSDPQPVGSGPRTRTPSTGGRA